MVSTLWGFSVGYAIYHDTSFMIYITKLYHVALPFLNQQKGEDDYQNYIMITLHKIKNYMAGLGLKLTTCGLPTVLLGYLHNGCSSFLLLTFAVIFNCGTSWTLLSWKQIVP